MTRSAATKRPEKLRVQFLKVPREVFAREDLALSSVLVYAAIQFLQPTPTAELVRELGWKLRTVQVAVAELVRVGLVEVEADPNDKRRGLCRLAQESAPTSAEVCAENCAYLSPESAQVSAPVDPGLAQVSAPVDPGLAQVLASIGAETCANLEIAPLSEDQERERRGEEREGRARAFARRGPPPTLGVEVAPRLAAREARPAAAGAPGALATTAYRTAIKSNGGVGDAGASSCPDEMRALEQLAGEIVHADLGPEIDEAEARRRWQIQVDSMIAWWVDRQFMKTQVGRAPHLRPASCVADCREAAAGRAPNFPGLSTKGPALPGQFARKPLSETDRARAAWRERG